MDDYLKKGFLKKIKIEKELIEKEVRESERDFDDAKTSFEMGKFKWAIIQSYYSMFHAARAVLFSLGLKERRHSAITIVLEDLVKKKKIEPRFVNDFKAGIFAREEADYEAEYSQERAESLLKIAEEFNKKMRDILRP
ncbi:MAG: HEPN domain-containing protein [Candidatus Bathyarchaeia archaeon]